MSMGINIFMSKNGIKIVKKKDSFGSSIEYHYKNDKLVEKIDYSTVNPRVWKYDSDGELINMEVLPSKSHKKLWLGIIGSLLVLGYLYSKCKSINHNPERPLIKSQQQER
jgi:hypothetical protein